jgi:hypothetical protein
MIANAPFRKNKGFSPHSCGKGTWNQTCASRNELSRRDNGGNLLDFRGPDENTLRRGTVMLNYK